MKKGEKVKKAKRLTIWIVVLSITGLFFISFLPWISVGENGSVKEDLYFNFEMMKNSSNEQIRDLASYLNLIEISLWALIILGLISFIGAIIHVSGKFSPVGLILLMIGCITLLCGIFVVYRQLIILKTLEEIDNISASAIFSSIKFTYIPLIPSVLTLICSALYVWIVVSHSIEKFKSLKKAKKDKNEEIKAKEPIKEKNETIAKKPPEKEITLSEPKIDEKHVEMEQWLADQIHDIEKQKEQKEIETPKQSLSEEKSRFGPFSPEKTKKKSEVISKEEKEEIALHIEEKPAKKTFSVRCPQCKHIFTAEKGDEITKIKCPKCGKEGVIK